MLDATTRNPLTRLVTVEAAGVRFLRNRAGLYVITAAPGLAAHTRSFQAPPPEPEPGSIFIEVRIDDPLGQYLPRLANLALPRRATAGAGEPELFTPIDILLQPSPAAPVRMNWSGVRLSLAVEVAGEDVRPLRGARINLRDASGAEPGAVLASGLSDERGEALLILAGLPLSRLVDRPPPEPGAEPEEEEEPGADEVTTPETPVRLEIVLDPALPWPVDPDRLDADEPGRRRFLPGEVIALATGRIVHRELTIRLGEPT